MTTLRLVGSPWRTDTFQRLATRLDKIVGSKTAKQFEPLKIFTVGDLMRHVPRRYFSGTELSDLSLLREGEEAAVMAEVVDSRTFNLPRGSSYRPATKPRLEVTITDHQGTLTCTFFGQPRLINYWHSQLLPGARGIFAGKVTRFNGRLQLAHPDFVVIDEHGVVIGGAKHNARWPRPRGFPWSAFTRWQASCAPGRSRTALRWPWNRSQGSRIRFHSGFEKWQR
jgi:ATP-dependent DNA helicase RecG